MTANKALIAAQGASLAALAERWDRALMFEAAVAGGIPIVKSLREGLAANAIEGVAGILNGTCNYILTEMEATGRSFAHVLAEASVSATRGRPRPRCRGRRDTAHKLSILAGLAFGMAPDPDGGLHTRDRGDLAGSTSPSRASSVTASNWSATPTLRTRGLEQRVHPQ